MDRENELRLAGTSYPSHTGVIKMLTANDTGQQDLVKRVGSRPSDEKERGDIRHVEELSESRIA